jgi:hypothetical protein
MSPVLHLNNNRRFLPALPMKERTTEGLKVTVVALFFCERGR